MGCCTCSVVLTVFGLFTIALGVILGWLVFPKVIENEIKKSVILKDGTDQYERWVNTPVPLDFKLYIFNVTNPEEASKGAKVNVAEIGPYVYKQYRNKHDISEDVDSDTLSYLQDQKYEFDEAASAPYTEDDVFTFANVPLLSVIQIAEADPELSADLSKINSNMKKVFNGATSVFLSISVKDYMFNGYNICEGLSSLNPLDIVARIICKKIKPLAPKELVPKDDGSFVFTFFQHKNFTDDGFYTVKTGKTDVSLVGEIVAWNFTRYTHFWTGGDENMCDKVYGNDATIFPPFLGTEEPLTIYSTDICRTISVSYTGISLYKGVEGYRYELGPENLMESDPSLGNECYCLKEAQGINNERGCLLAGALDLSTCHGAPIVLTLPHFLDADRRYQDSIDGLTPDEEKHVTYLEIEPNTGTPLRGKKRVQFNIFLRPVDKITMTKKLQHTLVPVMWIEEGLELPDDLLEILNESYFDVLDILNGVKWGLLAAGIIITVVSMGLCIRNVKHSTQTV